MSAGTVDPAVADPAAVPRGPALVTGTSLLLMAALAVWAPLAVLEPLLADPDPAATVAGAAAGVRAAAAAMLLVAVLDVVVAWALLAVLHGGGLARLAAWLRTAYAAGFVIAVSHVLVAVELVEGGASGPELGRAVAHELLVFRTMWDAGLLLIGLHLLLVGVVVLRAPAFPRWLGLLLVLAGVGYTVDALVAVLVADELFRLTTVTFVGEVVLAVWLLVAGARRARPAG